MYQKMYLFLLKKQIYNKYKINSFFNITFPKEDEYFD